MRAKAFDLRTMRPRDQEDARHERNNLRVLTEIHNVMIPKLDQLVTGEQTEAAWRYAQEITHRLRDIKSARNVSMAARGRWDRQREDEAVAALWTKLSGPSPGGAS
jgi:hypothetical protein